MDLLARAQMYSRILANILFNTGTRTNGASV